MSWSAFEAQPVFGEADDQFALTDLKVVDRVQSPGGRISALARFSVTPDAPDLSRG